MVRCYNCKRKASEKDKINCIICNKSYHTECVFQITNLNTLEYQNIIHSWFWHACTSDIFSFNHFVVNDDFRDNNLSMLHHNIRSVRQNLSELNSHLETIDYIFSIIALSETWLTEENYECYGIPPYSMESIQCENRRGGGVALLLRDNIMYRTRTDFNSKSDSLESVFVEISKEAFGMDKNIIVGAIYRPPRYMCGDISLRTNSKIGKN